jgi:hypothetical protein
MASASASASASSSFNVLKKPSPPMTAQPNSVLFVAMNGLGDQPPCSYMMPVHFPDNPQVVHFCQSLKKDFIDIYNHIEKSVCVVFTIPVYDTSDAPFTQDFLLRLDHPGIASSLRDPLSRVTYLEGRGWDAAWARMDVDCPNHGLNAFEVPVYSTYAVQFSDYDQVVSQSSGSVVTELTNPTSAFGCGASTHRLAGKCTSRYSGMDPVSNLHTQRRSSLAFAAKKIL